MILVVRETGNEGSDARRETYIDWKLEGEREGRGRGGPLLKLFSEVLNGSVFYIGE